MTEKSREDQKKTKSPQVDFRRKIADVQRDNRRYPRLEFHCPVRIQGVDGVHRITDISIGGVFVDHKEPSTVNVGQVLELIIKIPTELEPIKLKAEAVNVRKRGIGFKFVNLSRKNQGVIRFCFDTFKDTIPLR